jgi:predicted nuclease with TOPRIM domain
MKWLISFIIISFTIALSYDGRILKIGVKDSFELDYNRFKTSDSDYLYRYSLGHGSYFRMTVFTKWGINGQKASDGKYFLAIDGSSYGWKAFFKKRIPVVKGETYTVSWDQASNKKVEIVLKIDGQLVSTLKTNTHPLPQNENNWHTRWQTFIAKKTGLVKLSLHLASESGEYNDLIFDNVVVENTSNDKTKVKYAKNEVTISLHRNYYDPLWWLKPRNGSYFGTNLNVLLNGRYEYNQYNAYDVAISGNYYLTIYLSGSDKQLGRIRVHCGKANTNEWRKYGDGFFIYYYDKNSKLISRQKVSEHMLTKSKLYYDIHIPKSVKKVESVDIVQYAKGWFAFTEIEFFGYGAGDKSSILLKEKEKEISTLKSRLTDKEKKLSTASGKIKRLEEDIRRLKGEKLQLSNIISGLEIKVGTREGEIEDLNRTISDKNDEIDFLTETITTKNTKISDLELDIRKKNQEIIKLNALIKKLENELRFEAVGKIFPLSKERHNSNSLNISGNNFTYIGDNSFFTSKKKDQMSFDVSIDAVDRTATVTLNVANSESQHPLTAVNILSLDDPNTYLFFAIIGSSYRMEAPGSLGIRTQSEQRYRYILNNKMHSYRNNFIINGRIIKNKKSSKYSWAMEFTMGFKVGNLTIKDNKVRIVNAQTAPLIGNSIDDITDKSNIDNSIRIKFKVGNTDDKGMVKLDFNDIVNSKKRTTTLSIGDDSYYLLSNYFLLSSKKSRLTYKQNLNYVSGTKLEDTIDTLTIRGLYNDIKY